MEINLALFFASIFEGIKNFWVDSFLIAFLKFFLFIYCGVLLVNIILLFRERDVFGDLKYQLYQTQKPLRGRGQLIKEWEAIRERLESGSESQYKAAVIEADAFADEVLKEMSFHGENMKERLLSMRDNQIETKSELEEAHNFRNRIINEPGFPVSKEDASLILDRYESFFREVELFS